MLVSGRAGNFACHFTFLHFPPTSLDTMLSCPRYATISASLRNMLAASTALSTKIPHKGCCWCTWKRATTRKQIPHDENDRTLAVGPYKSTPTRSKVTGNDTKARPEGRRFPHQITMDLHGFARYALSTITGTKHEWTTHHTDLPWPTPDGNIQVKRLPVRPPSRAAGGQD